MTPVKIVITGPGLVVNSYVALVHKALLDAGVVLDAPEFAGQFQLNSDKDSYPHNVAAIVSERRIVEGCRASLEVNPLPWGG